MRVPSPPRYPRDVRTSSSSHSRSTWNGWARSERQFLWAADFLADRHIFTNKFLPSPKQLVPLAVIRVIMGDDADLLGPREHIVRWFWSGILGEVYGGAIETRFVRDIE